MKNIKSAATNDRGPFARNFGPSPGANVKHNQPTLSTMRHAKVVSLLSLARRGYFFVHVTTRRLTAVSCYCAARRDDEPTAYSNQYVPLRQAAARLQHAVNTIAYMAVKMVKKSQSIRYSMDRSACSCRNKARRCALLL